MNKEENISEVGVKDWFCFRRKGLKRYMDLYHLSLLHSDFLFLKQGRLGLTTVLILSWHERFAYNAFEEGLGWNLFPPIRDSYS